MFSAVYKYYIIGFKYVMFVSVIPVFFILLQYHIFID